MNDQDSESVTLDLEPPVENVAGRHDSDSGVDIGN